VIFRADVEAQAGAYATGVLVLMSSAAVAVTLSVRRRGRRSAVLAFGLITLVFAYTTIANIFERPEGVKIASFFIAAILTTSLISRVTRATELRVTEVKLDQTAQRFLKEVAAQGEIRIIANEPHARDLLEYIEKEHEERQQNPSLLTTQCCS
jgi:ABC-type transport system involved in cytochrome bd biosynthesis fused ATPase/permease subunit